MDFNVLYIVVALLAALIVLATWGLLRGHISFTFKHGNRRDHSLRGEIMHALEDTRRELRTKVETAEAAAATSRKIGQAVIAAVKPIEAALRDMNSRLATLEERSDGSDKLHAEHASLGQQLRTHIDNIARAGAETSTALKDIEGRLTATGERLSSLAHSVEGLALKDAEKTQIIDKIESGLRGITQLFEQLASRTDAIERGLAGQSEALKLNAEAVARLAVTFEQELPKSNTANQLITELATRVDTVQDSLEALSRQISGLLEKPSDLKRHASAVPSAAEKAPEDTESNTNEHAYPQPQQPEDQRPGPGARISTIPPGDRGGHPREDQSPLPGDAVVHIRPKPKLGLAAIRPNGHWQIFAELTAEDPAALRVIQGDTVLERKPDADEDLFGPLVDLRTSIRVFQENHKVLERPLPQLEPLFFRVRGDDFARSTRQPSRGLNLAVVPSNWQFDEEKSGDPPFEPEPLTIPGYSAHHFHPGRNPTLSFWRPDQGCFELNCAKPAFRLSGHLLPDAEQKMGPLIAGAPPTLEGDAGAVDRVRSVVIGAEGRGLGKWRTVCNLNGHGAEGWRIPQHVLPKGSGWYFIRLYDGHDELLDSLDFRYVPGLKSIEVDNSNDIVIKFGHNEGVIVTAPTHAPIQLTSPTDVDASSTNFALPWNPQVREFAFEVSNGGTPVRVSIDVDRIWWALCGTPAQGEPAWQLSPLHLTPDSFTGAADAELLLRFPRPIDFDAFVGFRADMRQRVPTRVDGSSSLRLYQFGDGLDLDKIGQHALKMWVRRAGTESEIDIAYVSITKTCRWCEARLNTEVDLVEHALTEHHGACFERLNLHGVGLHGTGIPTAIYVCLECGQSYPHSSLPSENPVTLLGRHSNESHKRMSYKRVDSPWDIKNLLGLVEKWVWKCKLDQDHIVTPAPGNEDAMPEKRDHLREEHLLDLIKRTELGA